MTIAGNTALDQRTGEAFVFDACAFYGHNEYDTGNWRTSRHRLSKIAYIREYNSHFPVGSLVSEFCLPSYSAVSKPSNKGLQADRALQISPPEEDWDARNLLYSLTFNIGNAIYVPGSSQRQVVYDDMTRLCEMFCPEDLQRALREIGDMDS